MKARFADRLRRINEKKINGILKKKAPAERQNKAREPDFIVMEKPKERKSQDAGTAEKTEKKAVKAKPKSVTNCPPEYAFFLANGAKINNLHELANHLDEMPDEVFGQHVNEEKNDFSNWVNDVVQEKELAEDMRKTKDRREHHVKVLKHVAKDVTNYIQ